MEPVRAAISDAVVGLYAPELGTRIDQAELEQLQPIRHGDHNRRLSYEADIPRRTRGRQLLADSCRSIWQRLQVALRHRDPLLVFRSPPPTNRQLQPDPPKPASLLDWALDCSRAKIGLLTAQEQNREQREKCDENGPKTGVVTGWRSRGEAREPAPVPAFHGQKKTGENPDLCVVGGGEATELQRNLQRHG